MTRMGVMLALAGLLTAPALQAQDEAGNVDKDVARLLKSAGAVTVARKRPYGGGIDSMHIGYGAEGKPVVGVALRKTKSYAEALAIVAVSPADEGYVIKAAEIPEIGTFRGKSQTLTQDALKDITGRAFKDGKAARGLVDAVSGATQVPAVLAVNLLSPTLDRLAFAARGRWLVSKAESRKSKVESRKSKFRNPKSEIKNLVTPLRGRNIRSSQWP